MFFFVYRRIESGKENKNALPDWGKEKQKGCLSMLNMDRQPFLRKNRFKKVYNFIIISRLLIYLSTVDLICKPKGCNCL